MIKKTIRDLLPFMLGAGLVLWLTTEPGADLARKLLIFFISSLIGAALSLLIQALDRIKNKNA